VTASSDLHSLADAVAKVPRSAMIAAAKATKKIALEQARPRTMKGKKRRAITLKARDKDLPARAGSARIRVYGTPSGPWVWITDGTDPHTTRRRKRGPMKKMTVRHPGTAGHGAWRKVCAQASVEVPEIFRKAIFEAVVRGR
jgi:hypothetical protein